MSASCRSLAGWKFLRASFPMETIQDAYYSTYHLLLSLYNLTSFPLYTSFYTHTTPSTTHSYSQNERRRRVGGQGRHRYFLWQLLQQHRLHIGRGQGTGHRKRGWRYVQSGNGTKKIHRAFADPSRRPSDPHRIVLRSGRRVPRWTGQVAICSQPKEYRRIL